MANILQLNLQSGISLAILAHEPLFSSQHAFSDDAGIVQI